jgi:hypothetical protein
MKQDSKKSNSDKDKQPSGMASAIRAAIQLPRTSNARWENDRRLATSYERGEPPIHLSGAPPVSEFLISGRYVPNDEHAKELIF